jgi:signal transduction histidine kinase
MLYEFIAVNRQEIIRRCRARVARRPVPPPADAEIEHGVPVFLDQVADALRLGATSSPEIGKSAIQHGHDLLLQGLTVSQVVHHYGDVCQAITELAVETNAPISTDEFRMLNRCLDEAIGGAVTQYGRDFSQSMLDGQAERERERLGFFAHELRNLTNTAIVAFEVLRTGDVGVGGSTGTVLHRSLLGLRTLISRALSEVRLTKGIENRERFPVFGFIEELAHAATLEANGHGVTLTVASVDEGAVIEADRQILAAVVGNLLQNAFKFTRPRTTVTLRVGASADRVLIAVEDECGGLPGESTKELFRPFEQRSTDRSGLGLGLAFARWGAEANDGRISTRNRPGHGCVFAVDLPRVPVQTLATT